VNILSHNFTKLGVVVATTLLLAACAYSVSTPEGAVVARQNLNQLKGNRELIGLSPVEIQEAEVAVAAAERPERDMALSNHLVLIADRKVEIARFWAQSRLYEKQRVELGAASEQARLDSRTHEAEIARQQARVAQGNTSIAQNRAAAARNDAAVARNQTNIARNDAAAAQGVAAVARDQATSARRDANAARMETQQLARLVSELNARNTDRGLVVTLGDVLFATGQSTIVGANDSNLANLAEFLNQYDDRTVMIEGHTDSVGADSSNMTLSQSRADAVKNYLVREGVAAGRLSAMGKGEGSPISSNVTDTGRQQNRRVEVIIANIPPITSVN
jgi:outer membrane protein OmpA-like peptidoglycan-associated protein